MLPKNSRANKAEVAQVWKSGQFLHSPNLTFKYKAKNGFAGYRISFIAPKSVAKLATARNALRRRGYEALKKYQRRLPEGLIGVFVFKKPLRSVAEIENELEKILHKLN